MDRFLKNGHKIQHTPSAIGKHYFALVGSINAADCTLKASLEAISHSNTIQSASWQVFDCFRANKAKAPDGMYFLLLAAVFKALGRDHSNVGAVDQMLAGHRQDAVAAVVYHTMGCCCGVLVLQHSQTCCEGIAHAASWLKCHALHNLLVWLMGAPAGLKLHHELSHALGSLGLWWLSQSEAVIAVVVKPAVPALLSKPAADCLWIAQAVATLGPANAKRSVVEQGSIDTGVIAIAGIVGGLPIMLALVQDLLKLAAAPITVAYICYLKLYRLQLNCTFKTWRLMRGNRDVLSSLRKHYGFQESPQKRHQMKPENLQDELGVEQMIVGVLLFTPLLLLLPTTLVYYVLALGLHATVFMACQAIQLVIELLYLNPIYFAWCWAFQPNLMPGTVAFLSVDQHKLHTPGDSGPKINLKRISLPCSLTNELASVFDTAAKRLDLNKELIMYMLAGKQFGCKQLSSPLERLQTCIVSAALAAFHWLGKPGADNAL